MTSVPILGFLLQAAAPMVGHTKTSQAAWSRTDRLRPKQGNEMGLLNRKQRNKQSKQSPKNLSHEFSLSLSSCCCQEPGCNRGTKNPDEMPRNCHARCPQQLFALSSGDESFACKYFLIYPNSNLKLALDHSIVEKYPQLTRALSEELFASPRRSWACQHPRFN